MALIDNFSPVETKTIAATSTSGSATFTAGTSATAKQCRVVNLGSSTAFIRFTTGASTAVTTDMPIPTGAVEVFNKGGADTVSAVCASGTTATLYFTTGEGS